MRILEREREKRERYERRNNIVVRGFREEGGDERKGEEVEEVFKKIGANVKVEDVKVMKTGKEERGMAVVRLKEGEA